MRTVSRFEVRGPTPRQIVAARVAMGWSQHELAVRAEVGIATVKRLESVTSDDLMSAGLRPLTIQKIVNTLEAAGVDFLEENDDRIGLMFSRRCNFDR